MDAVTRIRAARWADKDHVAALIADALQPSPLATWLIPDPGPRRRILTDVLSIWIEHAMFYGDIHLTDDAAATVGFHRYRSIPPPANYQMRLADAAGPHTSRFDILDRLLAGARPTEPHYELAFLAVRPSSTGAGYGTAMLAHHRSRLDHVGLASWASTTSASDLYRRHGYILRPPIILPDGPTLHPMRRNPESDGDRLSVITAQESRRA
ncbi:GNAT family N-acetyltransferase [Micromonospora hortensis]|uniref:GNAT family N-acetyltransferase n=1 Tax=Micromonospora hortensis TaxID=2911209 RepID=UPI001EE82DBC|nr:GNAT family N-acetyltransferase [Micromonospora hortensis]MCG5450993.1 GNAT family N-acetyltransferase [Micromonospora hortensis]